MKKTAEKQYYYLFDLEPGVSGSDIIDEMRRYPWFRSLHLTDVSKSFEPNHAGLVITDTPEAFEDLRGNNRLVNVRYFDQVLVRRNQV